MPTNANCFIGKIFRIQTKEIAIFVVKKFIITDLMIEEQKQMRKKNLLFFFHINYRVCFILYLSVFLHL